MKILSIFCRQWNFNLLTSGWKSDSTFGRCTSGTFTVPASKSMTIFSGSFLLREDVNCLGAKLSLLSSSRTFLSCIVGMSSLTSTSLYSYEGNLHIVSPAASAALMAFSIFVSVSSTIYFLDASFEAKKILCFC